MSPGEIISHFRLGGRLGEGGMGVVYEAEDLNLGRQVALKFLPSHLSNDRESKQRFIQEAKAASAIHHPNICTIYEIGETRDADRADGQLFIAMALYRGETLKQLIDRGPVPLEEARDLTAQIAAGLAKAHEHGIVHRDLKPANVIVTDEGRAVILDFGLAKLTGQLDITVAGSTLGTAPYMSPEQIEARSVDHRTDIWSLGVMLYEMLSGSRPFRGEYHQAVTYAIVSTEPEPLVGDLEGTWQIIQSCLRKDVDERLQAASDLVRMLRTSDGSSIDATSVPRRTDAGKKRTRMVIAGIAALVFLAGVAGIVWKGTWPSLSLHANSAQRPAIVVLPFEDLGEPVDEFFAAGMAHEITTRLASLSGLRVISSNSASKYAASDKTTREIGDELGVLFILDGSVRWPPNQGSSYRIRISPTLIRVSDDTQLWADTYEERLDDIFTVQSIVATRVVHALNISLDDADAAELNEELTDNFEAYQSYLRGLEERKASRGYYESDESERNALFHFEEAVRLDPGFVRGLAYVVRQSASLAARSLPDDRDALVMKARQAADRVGVLAAGSVEHNTVRGVMLQMIEGDVGQAKLAFREAYDQRPNDPDIIDLLAKAHVAEGDFEAAAELYEIAFSIDPLNADLAGQSATLYALLRRTEHADRMAERAFRADPTISWYQCVRSTGRLRQGDLRGAREWQDAAPPGNRLSCYGYGVDLFERAYDRVLAGLDSMKTEALGWRGSGFVHLYKARAFRFAGEKTAELAAWDSLRALLEPTFDITDESVLSSGQFQLALFLAQAYAGLGRSEQARNVLETGLRDIRGIPLEWSRWRMETAIAYTILGAHEEAVALLAEDLQSAAGWVTIPFLDAPFWDPLRGRPDFQRLTQ